jgi:hypothetical protein
VEENVKWVTVGLALLFATAPLRPENSVGVMKEPAKVLFWANELFEVCQDDSISNAKDAGSVIHASIRKGECSGYIQGSAESLGNAEGVCWPAYTSPDELVNGVKEMMEKDPYFRDKKLPAAIAVELSMRELFPCK